ncbi:UDP-N-acetylglucosamine 2-epimerase, partial [bacterium]|nr:UDP-N-acetylglucosamine 2-epimerase [bacterium]
MKEKIRKIAIITGSRGEYGYIRPIIKEITKNKNLDYGIIATNMHVLDTFGMTINEIKKDGFKIHSIINNTFDGYDHVSMVKSLAVFKLQLPEILKQMDADMILISGDRGEQLMSAITGAYLYIPVAHIQAGEVSGNIDGTTRHAITKFSHIHFTSNEDATERVKKLGEENFRIHNVGAPQIDELISDNFITPKNIIENKYDIDLKKPSFMFVYHSVTGELDKLENHLKIIMSAIDSFGYQTIVIMNNSDAGSQIIRKKLIELKKPYMKFYKNLSRNDYIGLINTVDVLIGNSSSGILEAPSFGLPAV